MISNNGGSGYDLPTSPPLFFENPRARNLSSEADEIAVVRGKNVHAYDDEKKLFFTHYTYNNV